MKSAIIKVGNHCYTVFENGVIQNKYQRTLKQRMNEHGYSTVSLFDKDYKVHRLVALAFIPNPENKPDVNHKDGDKQNNYDWNLEWVTKLENNVHCVVVLEKKSKIKRSDFESIIEMYKTMTRQQIADRYNTSTTSIDRILKRKRLMECYIVPSNV